MTVKELIAQLSQYHPDADVLCWASYENGDPMDDVANMVQITSIRGGHDEVIKTDDDTVFLNVTVGINPEDLVHSA